MSRLYREQFEHCIGLEKPCSTNCYYCRNWLDGWMTAKRQNDDYRASLVQSETPTKNAETTEPQKAALNK